eukprot:5280929-Heterocapsa_arctica.AAC.1
MRIQRLRPQGLPQELELIARAKAPGLDALPVPALPRAPQPRVATAAAVVMRQEQLERQPLYYTI